MFNSIHQNLALFVPKHSQNSEISGPKIPYLKKQTQFFPFLSPKTLFCQKQTQFKANLNPIKPNLNPIIWLYLTIKNSVNSVAINKSVKSAKSASKINAFYAKQTQTSSYLAQKPQFHQKTNPKRTQTKPNRWIAKMNLYPLLTKHYEKIRLFERNENKPKTNPNQTKTQVPKTRKFNPNSLVPIYRDWRGNPFRLKLQDLICIPIHEFNPNSLALKTVANLKPLVFSAKYYSPFTNH